MQFQTFTLPTFWACALINSDTSGMEDNEERALDQWFAATFPKGAHCVDVSEDTDFVKYHDASQFVLACDCSTFTFDVPEA